MESGGGSSKSRKKNQKRKQKKHAGDEGASGGASGGKPKNAAEWLPVLKEQLEKAKADMDHKLASKLRQQIWVITDMARGVKTDIEDDKLDAIVKELPMNQQEEGEASESAPPTPQAQATTADKRLKFLRKKLDAVAKLKEKKQKGETLEKNQLDKIESEDKILEEMEELRTLLSTLSV